MYSASKAAVIHLTRVIANEVGESNIRVNAIAPGAIPTAIFGRAGGMTQEAAEALIPMLRAGFATAQPIPRSGDANDVANAALWLNDVSVHIASVLTSFLTRQASSRPNCCARCYYHIICNTNIANYFSSNTNSHIITNYRTF